MTNKPVILCIMDGWGLTEASETNAVSSANTPFYDHLMAHYPTAKLQASGPAVGLPEGQPGNSEVGHMNIGAGRIVMQDLPRIDEAIASDALQKIEALQTFADRLVQTGGAAHITGLFSRGGVHAHLAHKAAIANYLTSRSIKVYLHAFTDGRDSLPKIAKDEWRIFQEMLTNPIQLATLTGRYYAMDRDKRWERTGLALRALVSADAVNHADSYEGAIDQAYEDGLSDEFILPTIIGDYKGLADGDGLFMSNYRVDRARQIMTGLLTPNEAEQTDMIIPDNLSYLSMTPVFSGASDIAYLFGPQDLSDGLGQVIAKAGLSQLRLAETEKYPHVTYFFNGGDEVANQDEERIVIPSPKVATYDLQPEMSASEVLDTALNAINEQSHDLIIINFANPDMVGHTGDVMAARKAVETVDNAIKDLTGAVEEVGGAMIITADHGNCEVMWDAAAKSPHTAHTTNLVPIIFVGDKKVIGLDDGVLADLAPSLLALLSVKQPAAMTGKSLLKTA